MLTPSSSGPAIARRFLAAPFVLVALLLTAGVASAATAPVTVTLEPVPTGTTKTAVERVANGPGKADTWILNANLLVTNNGASGIYWTKWLLKTPAQDRFSDSDFNFYIPAGKTARAQVTASFTGSYPLPLVSGKLNFSGFTATYRTFTLADMRHQAPAGAYYLPYKTSDLPSGTIWANNETQTDQSHHYGDPSQAYAYDVWVVRPTEEGWSAVKSGTTGSSNSHYLSYGLPIYAPDDGTILECRFSKPNLTPGQKDPTHRFGNAIWIRTGSGEVMGFGHLKQNSIPAGLCPTESVSKLDNGGSINSQGQLVGGTPIHADPVQVRAGQMIGRLGNSGNTDFAHTHMQVDRNAPLDVDDTFSQSAPGLPMMFHRFRAGGDRREGTSIPDLQTIGDASPHALPPYGLFYPNSPCSWLIVGPNSPEAAAAGLSRSCLAEGLSDAKRQGYIPTNLDGMKVGSTTSFNFVARPNRPTTRQYADMSASAFQSRFDALKKAGYRIIDIDNYLVGSTVAYAGVWAKTSGPGYAVYHGASQSSHKTKFDDLTAKGYRPRVVSATNSPGGLRYSAIYEKSGATGFVTEVTRESKFQDQFDLRKGQGLRPLDVDGLTIGATPYLSVTWDSRASRSYVMGNGMSFSSWRTNLFNQLGAGRLTASLTGYQSGSATRYASIWRK
ncbi:MAG TPA: hypothetical protein VJT75_18290 [Thermoleophilaceae bacterium]|nr:hypothetical protein [Thermoleophilaceae bacterium]